MDVAVAGGYAADMGAHETKTFRNGNGIAVELPDALGFGADERVEIERAGDSLTIRRAEPQDTLDGATAVQRLAAKMRAIGPVDMGPREKIIFPRRRGLS